MASALSNNESGNNPQHAGIYGPLFLSETHPEATEWQYPSSNIYVSVLRRGIKTRDSGILEIWLGSGNRVFGEKKSILGSYGYD